MKCRNMFQEQSGWMLIISFVGLERTFKVSMTLKLPLAEIVIAFTTIAVADGFAPVVQISYLRVIAHGAQSRRQPTSQKHCLGTNDLQRRDVGCFGILQRRTCVCYMEIANRHPRLRKETTLVLLTSPAGRTASIHP